MHYFRDSAEECLHHRARALGALLLLLVGGCSGVPSRITAPAVAPEAAAQQAITEYDKNGDGALDAKELEHCPALKSALKVLDKDGNGKITAEEIAARLATFEASGIGLVGLPCRVQLNGTPLEGATVTLTPETFMGTAFKPAAAVSDAQGNAALRVEGQTASGVPWGYYRITVSKKDAAGKELLAARYNTATTLGQEIAPDRKSAILLRLKKS